jgi:hypothetical protein
VGIGRGAPLTAPAAAVARALVGGTISPPHVGQAGFDEPLTGASTTSPQSEHFNNRVAMASASLVSLRHQCTARLGKIIFLYVASSLRVRASFRQIGLS